MTTGNNKQVEVEKVFRFSGSQGLFCIGISIFSFSMWLGFLSYSPTSCIWVIGEFQWTLLQMMRDPGQWVELNRDLGLAHSSIAGTVARGKDIRGYAVSGVFSRGHIAGCLIHVLCLSACYHTPSGQCTVKGSLFPPLATLSDYFIHSTMDSNSKSLCACVKHAYMCMHICVCVHMCMFKCHQQPPASCQLDSSWRDRMCYGEKIVMVSSVRG